MDSKGVGVKNESEEEDDVLCSLLSQHSGNMAHETAEHQYEMERIPEIDEPKYSAEVCDLVTSKSDNLVTHTAERSYESVHCHWNNYQCLDTSSHGNSRVCHVYDKSLTSYMACASVGNSGHDSSAQNKPKSPDTHRAVFVSDIFKSPDTGRVPLVCDSVRTNSTASLHQSSEAFSQPLALTVIPRVEKLHQCELCHTTFRAARALASHRRCHSGVMSYACDICSRRFRNACHLRMHECTHSAVKPYRCDVCNRSFRCKGAVTVHKHFHTRKRPCVCCICYRAFDELSELNEHKRIHDWDNQFLYDVLDKVFWHGTTVVNKILACLEVHSQEFFVWGSKTYPGFLRQLPRVWFHSICVGNPFPQKCLIGFWKFSQVTLVMVWGSGIPGQFALLHDYFSYFYSACHTVDQKVLKYCLSLTTLSATGDKNAYVPFLSFSLRHICLKEFGRGFYRLPFPPVMTSEAWIPQWGRY